MNLQPFEGAKERSYLFLVDLLIGFQSIWSLDHPFEKNEHMDNVKFPWNSSISYELGYPRHWDWGISSKLDSHIDIEEYSESILGIVWFYLCLIHLKKGRAPKKLSKGERAISRETLPITFTYESSRMVFCSLSWENCDWKNYSFCATLILMSEFEMKSLHTKSFILSALKGLKYIKRLVNAKADQRYMPKTFIN